MIHAAAYGTFVGVIHQLNDQPIPSLMLEEDHRYLASTVTLRAGIAAYEALIKGGTGKGELVLPWPANFVAYYQGKFTKDYTLFRAWQSVPANSLVNVLDTVRNRVLEFSLEIQGDVGEGEAPSSHLALDKIENAVVAIIYGEPTSWVAPLVETLVKRRH